MRSQVDLRTPGLPRPAVRRHLDLGLVLARERAADPDFPLSNRQGLQQEPTRYALGLLPLVVRGETVAGDLVSELRSQGVIRARDGQRGCLAAPITDASGTLAGALSYSGPRRQIDSSDSIALSLVAAARELGPLLT